MELIWILCKGFSHEWIRSTMAWMIQNMGASNWLGDFYFIEYRPGSSGVRLRSRPPPSNDGR